MRALVLLAATLAGGVSGCAGGRAAPAVSPVQTRSDVPADAIDPAKAAAVADGQSVTIVAWLRSAAPQCQPCPKGAACSPCEQSVSTYGPGPAPASGEVTLPVVGDRVPEADVGRQFVLEGKWIVSDGQRVFYASRAQRVDR